MITGNFKKIRLNFKNLRIYKRTQQLLNFKKFLENHNLQKKIFSERDLEFIESVNITGDYSGWLEINMTIPLTKWVAFQETNKGLYLSMYQADKPGISFVFYSKKIFFNFYRNFKIMV